MEIRAWEDAARAGRAQQPLTQLQAHLFPQVKYTWRRSNMNFILYFISEK